MAFRDETYRDHLTPHLQRVTEDLLTEIATQGVVVDGTVSNVSNNLFAGVDELFYRKVSFRITTPFPRGRLGMVPRVHINPAPQGAVGSTQPSHQVWSGALSRIQSMWPLR